MGANSRDTSKIGGSIRKKSPIDHILDFGASDVPPRMAMNSQQHRIKAIVDKIQELNDRIDRLSKF